MFKRLLTGLALSACSLLLTLGVLEFATRRGAFANPQPRSTKLDVEIRSPVREPTFRGFEPRLPRKTDTFRILIVGDSFSWGHGVHPEDSFPRRLETRLDAVSRGDDFEVVNWSRPGWNTVVEYRSVESNIDEISPDLLLLTFVLNDPEPFDLKKLSVLRADLQRRQPRVQPSAYLYSRSQFYAMAWDRIENMRIHRAYSTYYHSLYEGPDWKNCLKALERFRDLGHARSIPMALLLFPVFDSPMNDDYAYADLHDKLRGIGRSLGIPVLDLLEAYRGVDVYRLALVPYTDAHPNELAHRIAADAILDYLARGRLVPKLNYKPQRQRDRWKKKGARDASKDNGAP